MKPVIAVIGPTAAGKTRIAVEVAEKVGGEVPAVAALGVRARGSSTRIVITSKSAYIEVAELNLLLNRAGSGGNFGVLSASSVLGVSRKCNCCENTDNCNNDHQFDEGKTILLHHDK